MIPLNWGIDGEVAHGSRTNILWIAAMGPAILGLLTLVPRIDPRKGNFEKFRGFYDAMCLFVMAFMLVIAAVILSESFFPGRLRVEFATVALCGLLFAFIGNIMPKFRSNFFAGIRTPWTLSSDAVWNRTHRLAGRIWFAGGLLTVLAAFILSGPALFAALMATIAVMTVIPVVMSYVWYRREAQGGSEARESS